MKVCFADTSFFLALLNARDALHAQAKQLLATEEFHLLTTDWVLVEVGDAMSTPSNRPRFVSFYEAISKREDISILAADETRFRSGLALFAARPDKSWSLTDCISFVSMKQFQIDEALTADQHFSQAGFLCLLK